MKNLLLRLVAFATLLLSANSNFAQAPDLGTTAGFVLFSSNGAVTSGGVISQVTGNVGNNIGALSGFGNVNGVMHNSDGATAQCAADLQLAYDSLNRIAATFFPVSSTLGSGDTLTAGIYALPGVTTLNSNLYLDAGGDAGATFIFKIPGAFSTTSSSGIKLINGAQACNVYWTVDGAVTMASKTSMKGTLIAHNAINIAVNDTLEGRALSIAGAVGINGVLAYTPTGCGSPVLTGPAAPDLGTTACYAIFSGNGAVANDGVTHVTGDIGTNVTLTTGYNPLLVTGSIHAIPDGSTAACAADLLNLYNALNIPGFDIQLLFPAQFGHNLVLTPHTYLLNSATSLTDTLYLNAQGNSDAVFLLKINGALTTSTFSKVILINGTKASNVFWKIEGAVSINDYSVFNGTIVCNNGAISLKIGDTLNGRALTTSGALSTAAIVVTIPSGTCSTLPVSLLYFQGKPKQENVLLEWAIANELNKGFYSIEKSKDGHTFETIATVNALGKAENGVFHYSFTDIQPYSLGYYRISQVDKNGQKIYFNTILVKIGISQGFKALPYVKGNTLYVKASGAVTGPASIILYATDGKKMSSQKIKLSKEISIYKIEKQLDKGIYFIYIESYGQRLYNGKVIVL